MPEPHYIPLDFFCNRTYASDPEMEQVVMLTVVGTDAVKSAGELLHQILLPGPNSQSQSPGDFQLLGRAVEVGQKSSSCLSCFYHSRNIVKHVVKGPEEGGQVSLLTCIKS